MYVVPLPLKYIVAIGLEHCSWYCYSKRAEIQPLLYGVLSQNYHHDISALKIANY